MQDKNTAENGRWHMQDSKLLYMPMYSMEGGTTAILHRPERRVACMYINSSQHLQASCLMFTPPAKQIDSNNLTQLR